MAYWLNFTGSCKKKDEFRLQPFFNSDWNDSDYDDLVDYDDPFSYASVVELPFTHHKHCDDLACYTSVAELSVTGTLPIEEDMESDCPDEYTMELESKITSSTKGVALIMTNPYHGEQQLTGTYQDGQKFTEFLLECNYEVFWYHGITKKDFTSYCAQLAKFQYPTTCRRLLVVFSGHGGENQLICQDGKKVLISKMVQQFKPANAKNHTLGNMVRMFFIDACRGINKSPGYPSKYTIGPTNDEISLHKKYPNDVNMLVAYSTTSQYYSTETERGGIWINYLLEELKNNPYEDLLSILVRVNGIMMDNTIETEDGEHYQIGEHVSTLAEKIYFERRVRLVQSEDDSEDQSTDQSEAETSSESGTNVFIFG